MTGDGERVSFLGGCPRGFRLRTVVLPPRDALDYVAADWLDTVVVVERGELELECRGGSCLRLHEGAVLVLPARALRRLRNPGDTTLVLTALSRSR